jgi:hypothetical protein
VVLGFSVPAGAVARSGQALETDLRTEHHPPLVEPIGWSSATRCHGRPGLQAARESTDRKPDARADRQLAPGERARVNEGRRSPRCAPSNEMLHRLAARGCAVGAARSGGRRRREQRRRGPHATDRHQPPCHRRRPAGAARFAIPGTPVRHPLVDRAPEGRRTRPFRDPELRVQLRPLTPEIVRTLALPRTSVPSWPPSPRAARPPRAGCAQAT